MEKPVTTNARTEFGEGERYLKQCEKCRGAGWLKATLMISLPEIDALVKSGFGNKEPPIHKQECRTCSGTGRVYAG